MEDRVLEGLNPQQKEAVTHADGPLLIIAGAGTGKTAVITRRIAYLIAAGRAKQEEILALTFTDKAAAEMEERVDILLPYGYTDIWISTFHAFGDRILRENALELGLDPEFQVLTRPESIIFFREHLFEFPLIFFRPLSEPTRYIEAMVNLFSRAKDEDISPEEYLEYAKKLKEKSLTYPQDEELKETSTRQMEIASSYAKYQELLDRFGKVDFGNQFLLTLKLFRSHPAILKRYQEQFKYILVDEFQDTNYAQFQLVKLLATKYKNITVVADDDQCLPPNALIDTVQGKKKIEDIKRGDIVITAVGNGHIGTSKVVKVLRRKRRARFLTFITEKGYRVTVTSNHKMFCFVPVAWIHGKELFYLGKLRTQHKPALVMPASNVLVGHYLPIRIGNRIIYDKIRDIKEEIKTEDTYDLEIDRTHNFIADGVVVHNCVFRFRGAAYSNMLNFMDVYPAAKKITLIQNYRSPQIILDTAYRLIQYNNPDRFEVKSNINKRLVGLTEEGQPVKHLRFDTVSSEADGVAKIIDEKVKSGQYSYQDFAILVRSNSDADPFLRALNMRGIPWRFTGNQGLYNRDEIRLIIAFLRTITNLLDSISLYHLASSEIYNLNPVRNTHLLPENKISNGIKMLDLTRCSNFATRKNRPLFDVFRDLARIPELGDLSTESKATIAKLIKDIEKFTEVSRLETTGRVLYRFLTETGYISRLSKTETKEADEKIQNIAKFFELVKNFQTIALQDRAIQFVSHLDMLIRAGDDPATVEADIDIPAVNILTIHKAKGLEFSVVFLVSLVMGRFPWPRRREPIELPDELIKDILPSGDFHIEEERRLFYVGMTRAKKELYLTSARDYGGNRLRKMSQFVYEALELSKEEETVYKASALEAIERHAPPAKQELDLTCPIPDDQILTLSYFQVDDYLTCPLKYKYVHILRVPILQHHTVIYGKALHDAVEHYHRCKVKGVFVEIDDLISAFESSWRSEGFLSREHEEQRLESGRAALRRFFETEEKKKIIPTYVEKDFSVVLDNDRLIGRWDRIDIIDEEVSIIDFKSSEIRKKKDADKRTKESLQLLIYALAYQKMFGRIPEKVELHFLESGLIGVDKKTEGDLQKTIENIKEASKGIRSRNFNAQPEYLACRYCAYNQICPYTTSKG